MPLKTLIKELLIFFHLDLTKNLKYDRLTKKIIKKCVQKSHNCIDVGCHKGEILIQLIKQASNGKHYAFEPIPYLFQNLTEQFKNTVTILPYALSNNNGKTTFQLVKNAPAYSGIRRRKYDIQNPEIEEINVEKRTLDSIVPIEEHISFIKIDVEGGEFDVLKGAENLLKRCKPIILFECGKGASDFYNTTPNDIYDFLIIEIGLKLFTLSSFIKNQKSMSKIEFENYFDTSSEYYFVAAPISN
jgi:FkbM family methyltransferase